MPGPSQPLSTPLTIALSSLFLLFMQFLLEVPSALTLNLFLAERDELREDNPGGASGHLDLYVHSYLQRA